MMSEKLPAQIRAIVIVAVAMLAIGLALAQGAEPTETPLFEMPGTMLAAITSSDVHHVASVVRIDERQYVYRDAVQLGGPYDKATWLRFSPDGTKLAWSAWDQQRWSVYLDGVRVGSDYGMVTEPMFSPDGQALAFKVLDGGRWRIMRNGAQLGREWSGTTADVVFNHDWSSMACVLAGRTAVLVMRDGVQVGGRWRNALGLSFQPGGNGVAFYTVERPTREERIVYVVKNGTPVDAGHESMLFGPLEWDGEAVVYPAWDGEVWRVYRDGAAQGAGWPGIKRSCYPSPDRQHAITFEAVGDRFRALRDGVPVGEAHDAIDVVWNPDSQSVVFLTYEGKDFATRTMTMERDGRVIDGPCARLDRITFSPDGTSMVWVRAQELTDVGDILRDGAVIASGLAGIGQFKRTPTGLACTVTRGSTVYRFEIVW